MRLISYQSINKYHKYAACMVRQVFVVVVGGGGDGDGGFFFKVKPLWYLYNVYVLSHVGQKIGYF